MPVSEAQMPQYYEIVRDLTTRAGLPMPRLYVSPVCSTERLCHRAQPQARRRRVTQGILQICTWSELRGVLAHEISHVRNRDILISSVAASIALGITFLARMAAWSGLFFGGAGGRRSARDDDNIFALLAMVILAPLAAAMLQLALSRSREYEADRDGARLIGDGEPLASALAKLDAASRQIPMQVPREVACLYIVNPLAGRRVALATGSATTRRHRSASPGCVPRSGPASSAVCRAGQAHTGRRWARAGQSLKFSNWSGIPKSCSFKARDRRLGARRVSLPLPAPGRPGRRAHALGGVVLDEPVDGPAWSAPIPALIVTIWRTVLLAASSIFP